MTPAPPDPAAVDAAFGNALRQVDRAVRARMRTLHGDSAAPQLAQLRAELEAERHAARTRGSLDAEWLRRVIRWVAGWAPESDVSLIAALGGVARLRAPGSVAPES